MTYDRLYQKLEIKESENEDLKLTRVEERRTRDLGNIRCLKDEDGKVTVDDAKIKDR